jgi:hypothetical protein
LKAKVVHCKKEPYTVYIGRPSKWGNPYSHKPGAISPGTTVYRVESREDAVHLYEKYIRYLLEEGLMEWAELEELEGEVLGCWCKPKACHGDVLVKLLEELDDAVHTPRG